MRITRKLSPGLARGAVVTIGALDGLHLGHAKIIREVVRRARRANAPSVVVTFDPHPEKILRGSAPPRLLSPQDRDRILADWGIDLLVVLRSTRRLLSLSPVGFLDRLDRSLAPRAFVVGANFRFGKNRAGSPETIRARGFSLRVVPPVPYGRAPVSSTRIRRALAAGQLDEARACLGRDVEFPFRAVRGAGRGRRLGFPTLNSPVPTPALRPGVYAGRVEGRPAVLHLGPRPTFGEAEPILESHLLDRALPPLDAQAVLRVSFLHYLRPVRRFPTPRALVRQIRRDVLQAEKYLARV